MTDESHHWLPPDATEGYLERLVTPDRVARPIGLAIAEVARRYGALPGVNTLAVIISEALANDPFLQELGQSDIDPDDALELAAAARLATTSSLEQELGPASPEDR